MKRSFGELRDDVLKIVSYLVTMVSDLMIVITTKIRLTVHKI